MSILVFANSACYFNSTTGPFAGVTHACGMSWFDSFISYQYPFGV